MTQSNSRHAPAPASPRLSRQPGPLARFRDDEGGAMMVWNLFWTITFLILGGISVDTANAWRVKNMLQVTADSAAFAAALHIEDTDLAVSKARQIAEINMPAEDNGGDVMPVANIEFGSWDPNSRSFVSGAMPANAVRATAQRTAGNGNRVPTLLLRLAGWDTWDIQASSIAMAKLGNACPNGTFVSQGFTNTGGGNALDQVCIHGEDGLMDGGNGYYQNGTRLSAPTPGPTIPNVAWNSPLKVEDVRVTESKANVVTPLLQDLFDSLWALYGNEDITMYQGAFPLQDMLGNPVGGVNIVRIDASQTTPWNAPLYTAGGQWLIRSQAELAENTLYLVDGNVMFAGGVGMAKKGVSIVATGAIGTGGGNDLRFSNVMFFAGGMVNMAGSSRYGYFASGSYCDSGYFNSYLFSLDDISLGGFYSGSGLQGTLVAALGTLNTGGGMTTSGAVYMESEGDMFLGGGMNLSGCGVVLENHLDVTLPGASAGGTSLVY